MSEQLKFIDKDTDIKSLKKLFYDADIVVNNKPYIAVKIYGYYHSVGGKYVNNDLYIFPRDEEPTYDNLVEFHGEKLGPTYGIRYEPYNYIRNKHNLECFTTGGAMITRNGKDFYFCRKGISEAQYKISVIEGHPLNFNDIDYIENIIGRKVWWRSQPGIITDFIDGQACVIIKPDGIDKFSIPNEFKDDDIPIDDASDIKVEIFSDHIWWFRD